MPEERARAEGRPQPLVGLPLRARRSGHLAERGGVLAEVDGHAVGPSTHPHDLAARAERVELLGPVSRDAARQKLGLPQGHGKRQSLQGYQSFAKRSPAIDAVPRGQEARQRRLLDRLDLLAERGKRGAAQPAQDVGVAPLALDAAGAKLAADQQLLSLQRSEDRRRRSRSKRSFASAVVNGPRPFAKRSTSCRSESGPPSRNTSGSPPGGIAPSASR